MKKSRVLAMAAGIAALGSGALAQTWSEVGDAGQNNIGEAQMTVGVGALTQITGVLGGNGDVDLYCIRIVDEANFSAMTTTGSDPQIFLFTDTGFGQVHNDDFVGLESGLNSDGVFTNGLYYLAISGYNNDPRDAANTAIFGFTTYPGVGPGQRMPNTAATALNNWTGGGSQFTYSIALTGAEFCQIPAPGSAALLGLGGVLAARRRRA